MYLHLGQDVVVLLSSVIGVFDLENTTQSRVTRSFLKGCEKKGLVVNVGEELPKSFTICNENNKTTVYVSQISAQTLSKRSRSAPAWPEP